MTDLIRRKEAVKACKELCIDGPTDALDTGRHLGVGECINAIRSIPAFEPAGPTAEEVAEAMFRSAGYDGPQRLVESRPRRHRDAEGEAMTRRVTNEQADLMARCEYDPMIQIGLAPPVCASDLAADLLDSRAEIATLREQLAKVCEVGKDLRDTAFCDVIVALDCPRGDCDCCTCEAVGKFDAAIAAARKGEGE